MKFRSFFRFSVFVSLVCGVVLSGGHVLASYTREEVKAMIARTQDPDWEIRSEAVRVLGLMALDHPEARKALTDLSSDYSGGPFEDRRRIFDAAQGMRDFYDIRKEVHRVADEFEKSVFKIRGDTDLYISAPAPKVDIARQKASDSVRLLARRYPQKRTALLYLADQLDRRIAPIARAALDHAAEQVLLSVRELRTVAGHDPAARKALVSRVWDPSAAVRTEVFSALGALAVQHDDIRVALFTLAFRHENSGAAIRALAPLAIEDSEVRDLLSQMAGRPDSASRIAVAEVLGSVAIRDASMRSGLLALAHDSDETVRNQAARSIQEMSAGVSSATLGERQALASDFLNHISQSSRSENSEALARALEEVLAVLARHDPSLRLQLLRRAALLDIPFLKRSLTHSLDRWQGAAIRILERTYSVSFAPEQGALRGIHVISHDSTTYRELPRATAYQESPEIAAFLEGRNRFSRLDPRGPGANERALLGSISQFLTPSSSSCPTIADVVRR